MLSALKPLEYDGIYNTQIMAGVGHFRGITGLAVSIGHYRDSNTFLNLGLGLAKNDFVWNAGI